MPAYEDASRCHLTELMVLDQLAGKDRVKRAVDAIGGEDNLATMSKCAVNGCQASAPSRAFHLRFYETGRHINLSNWSNEDLNYSTAYSYRASTNPYCILYNRLEWRRGVYVEFAWRPYRFFNCGPTKD